MTFSVNNIQTSNSETLSYTPSSVSNAVLVVVAAIEDITQALDSVDFGATEMTQQVHIRSTSYSSYYTEIGIYTLASPGASAETITVNSGSAREALMAFTLGATAAVSVGINKSTAPANGASASHTFTPLNDDGIAITAMSQASTMTLTEDSPQIDLGSFNGESNTSNVSYETYEIAASKTHGYTFSSTQRISLVTLAFWEAAAGGRPQGPLGHPLYGPLAGPIGL